MWYIDTCTERGGVTMILTALIGICFFAALVAILSIPWMKNTETK